MPRELIQSTNQLRLHDNLSDSEIVLFYRDPTTKERSAYTNASFQRKRNKIVNRVFETRVQYGLKILEGFRDGDFVVLKEGKKAPIASDPNSPNYDPQWKKCVETHASDLVALLAAHIFETPAEIDGEDEDGENDGEDAEKN